MKKLALHGTGVALVTPFVADNSKQVDFQSLSRLIKHVTQAQGVDYLVLMGTTAETVNLTIEEKCEIINFVAQNKPTNMPIVLGIGGNNLLALESDLAKLPIQLAAALMLVTPYYNKPTQDGLYAYYQYAHQITQHSLLIYNVPGRTGINIHPETSLSLARDCERIIGIKEANTDINHCLKLNAIAGNELCIISGNDSFIPVLSSLGMHGIISVCANAYPVFIAQIVRKIMGSEKLSSEMLANLYNLDRLCFLENNPAGVKYILSELKICANILRLPLTTITQSSAIQIQNWMDSTNLNFQF